MIRRELSALGANPWTAHVLDEFVTGDCGVYQYVQTFPALYPTRRILHLHFRLSRSDGSDNINNNQQHLLTTQMYFVGDGDGYVADTDASRRRQLQSAVIHTGPDGERLVNFDFYVDVEGDVECGGRGSSGDSVDGDDADGNILSTEESSGVSWNNKCVLTQ